MSKEFNDARRRFVKVVGTGGLVLSTNLLAPLLTGNDLLGSDLQGGEPLRPTGRHWTDLSVISCADLEPHVGQGFALYDTDGSRLGTFILNEARVCGYSVKNSRLGTRRAPFSLLFFLPERFQVPIENRIYELRHRDLSLTSLFIHAVCPSGRYFEACFN